MFWCAIMFKFGDHILDAGTIGPVEDAREEDSFEGMLVEAASNTMLKRRFNIQSLLRAKHESKPGHFCFRNSVLWSLTCYCSGRMDFKKLGFIRLYSCLWTIVRFLLFLPRCMECSRGIAMGILSVSPSVRLSVCLSVCLSVHQTRALWQNGRKLCLDFYII